MSDITYPLSISNGNLSVSSGPDIVKHQILSVLQTRPFERVSRSDYGFDDGIFDIVEPNAINARILKAIEDNVKGASNVRVQQISTPTETEEGIYRVTILYEVNGEDYTVTTSTRA